MSIKIYAFITTDDYYFYVRDNKVIISTYVDDSDLVEQGMNAVLDFDLIEHVSTFSSDDLDEMPENQVGRCLMDMFNMRKMIPQEEHVDK